MFWSLARWPIPKSRPRVLRPGPRPSISGNFTNRSLKIRLCANLHCAENGPHERRQLSGDGCDCHLAKLTPGNQSLVPLAQSHLGLPGDLPYLLRKVLLPIPQPAADPGRHSIGPCCLCKHSPRMAVAGLGDSSPFCVLSSGVLGGDQSKISHKFAGIVKSSQIANFCNYRRCYN